MTTAKKPAVLIDLTRRSELGEDFYDPVTAPLGANGPREPLESVKIRLSQKNMLDG
jgi:hypothetical protein